MLWGCVASLGSHDSRHRAAGPRDAASYSRNTRRDMCRALPLADGVSSRGDDLPGQAATLSCLGIRATSKQVELLSRCTRGPQVAQVRGSITSCLARSSALRVENSVGEPG